MVINWQNIATVASQISGVHLAFENPQPISGGCINQTWRVTNQQDNVWFVKLNKPHQLSMFTAEAEGLKAIRETQSIRVPEVLCAGKTKQASFLVMEYIDLSGQINTAQLGELLAKMHHTKQDYFGWHCNNTIGTTPQINNPEQYWPDFWQKHRLHYQLDLALSQGLSPKVYDKGLKLAEAIPLFFSNYSPSPSLLHGDLWTGNCAADSNNNPIIFDPACYFGDREADLAMTELFGGFGSAFKNAYHYHYPIDSGYNIRKNLYNLYHILNHYNLFGGSYESQSSRLIDLLLTDI